MLRKAHNPSGRLVRGRMACLVVLCVGLWAGVVAGNAFAGAPLAGVLGGVGTVAATASADAVAPLGRAATQALGTQPSPATNAPPPSPAGTATARATALTPAAAGPSGVTPLAQADTQSASGDLTPPAKVARQSTGRAPEPVSRLVTQGIAPSVQHARKVLAPASPFLHRGTSSRGKAGDALVAVVKGAAGTATGILTPAIAAGHELISAPQGASAALRGAIGAVAGVLSARIAGPSGCALLGPQALSSERCGALRPRRPASRPGSRSSLGVAAGSAPGTGLVRTARDGSGGARADPAARGASLGPVPGPAPGGASGSAAALGFALSVFLALAVLLLTQTPRAIRRLRLQPEPWLAAHFVLVPERPG